jgi:hypothetical protein
VRFLRRYSFSITLVIAILGVGALIYYAPERLSPEQSFSEPASTSASETKNATLSVYSEPAGATVVVGADTAGITPLESHRVRAGTYLVSISKEDYVERDTAMTISANQSLVYAPQLRREAPSGEDEQDAPSGLSTTEDFRPAPSPDRSPERGSDQESYAGEPSNSPQPQRTSQGQALRSEPPANDGESSDEGSALVTGSLELRADPGRATVELNGYRVGSTPVRLDRVAAGTHEITFSRPGYETVTRQVQINGRDTVTVEASLKAQSGYLRVLVRPWGSIYIDGQRRVEDSDVWYETKLQAGTYTVRARHPALGGTERTVEVAPRDTQSVVIDLREN